jgi:hypothetical protein
MRNRTCGGRGGDRRQSSARFQESAKTPVGRLAHVHSPRISLGAWHRHGLGERVATMTGTLRICRGRHAMVVLASGVAIALTALTSGVVVPANALPVTTTTPAPAPRTVEEPPPTHEAPPPTHEAPPPPPPAPEPTHEAPVQTFAPQTTVAPAPVITTSAPPVITTTAAPAVTTAAPAVTTTAAPITTTAAPATTTTRGATSSSATTSVAGPTTGSSTSATATTGAAGSTTASSTAASSTTASGTETTHTTAAGTSASPTGVVTGTSGSRTATTTSGSSSTVVQAGQTTTPTETPKRLPVNAQNVELAKQSIPVQQNPDPAPQTEIRRLTNLAINVNVNNPDNPPNPPGGAPHKFDPNQRSAVRQFDPKLVYYDEYYRPIIANPYQQPLQVVYIYQGAPRILVIPPLASAVTELAALGAYSFTAMVLNAVGIPTSVAVGNMMGGGYYPAPGQPPPPPPPPVVPYDNVPVQVQYTDATYQPFVVNRVVDVGDDPAVGERKVLLDGVTPAWGVWTTNSDGQRQFEVHKTQQFPGMDDPPGEGPLPGDYQMQLASSSKPASPGLSTTDLLLIGGAVVVLALGIGAIALNVMMGRRRPHRH